MGMNSPKQQDKDWPIVNRANNHIYVTWTQFDAYGTSDPADSSIIQFSKSVNAGVTWSSPVRISKRAGDCVDGSSTDEGAVPAVGPAGQIYVSWAGPVGLMFNRSLDEGATWVNANIFVNAMQGGWNMSVPGIDRSNGMPICCCDLSQGPYRGNIYIVFKVHQMTLRNGAVRRLRGERRGARERLARIAEDWDAQNGTYRKPLPYAASRESADASSDGAFASLGESGDGSAAATCASGNSWMPPAPCWPPPPPRPAPPI